MPSIHIELSRWRDRHRPLRAIAMLCSMIIAATLVQLVAQSPAAAVVRRTMQGIQAGDVLDFANNCAYSDSANTLLNDADVQDRSGYLRLDFRGMHKEECARTAYPAFIGALRSGYDIIGLLGANFYPDVAFDEFARYAGEIACHSDFDRVTVWEVWNEPNISGGAGATPLSAEDFARVVGLTSKAIHTCNGTTDNSSEKVISGGLTPADPVTYLQTASAALERNAGDPNWGGGYDSINTAVNGIGIHPYVHAIRSGVDVSTASKHQPLADMVYQFTTGFNNEPVYITEFGWRLPVNSGDPVVDDFVTPEDQCYNLITAYDALTTESNIAVTAAIWFTLKDFGVAEKKYGLYDGPTARPARQGYVDDTCDGVQAGIFNEQYAQLEWQDTVALAAKADAISTADGAATMATTSYEVVLAPSNSPTFTMTRTTSSPVLPLTAFSPPLPIGTYVWQVIKIVDGVRKPSKEQWKFTFLGKPAPPSNPSAVASADGTSIKIYWTDNANSENGFVISDGSSSRNAMRDDTAFTWTGLTPGTFHCYQVQSYNDYGGSQWTPQVCATTPSFPAAPSNVTATVVTGTSVRINWSDNSTNETQFEVNDGVTTKVVNANLTTYTWEGIANGASKCFKVRSYNLVGYSPWAGNACATTPTIPIAPTTPTAVVASGTSIKVGWADKSNNEWGFEISNGSTSKVVGANYVSYTWDGLANGTYMCFKVRSYNLAGYSAWTASKCATTPTIPIMPASPIASVVSGTSIKLAWADRSSNEIGFEISNGSTSKVVGANYAGYTWTGLANGTTTCLRVRSYNLAGYSAWTAYSCATTPTIPIAPTIVSAYAISTSQIKITWTDRSNNETMFQVYNQMSFANVGANLTSHTWNGIAPNTTMCFNVRSYNLAGSSTPTPYVCATTPGPPLAPSNQAAVPISSSVIKVTWTDRSSNETGFWVYDGVQTVHVPANQPYYYKSGLAPHTYKCFSVAAYNSYGQSAFTPYACTYSY